MRGSKPMDALRTLPERAFRLRARLIAVGLCAVCFAGLIGRLFWLQLCTGGWYTQRALGQQLRDTVVPADRGKIYSADGALLAANSSCWTLRASPGRCRRRSLPSLPKGLAEILELDETKLLEKVQRPALQRLPFALPGGAGNCRCSAGFLRRKRHYRRAHQSGFQALVPAGRVSGLGAGVYQCGQRRGQRAGAEI